MGGLLGAADPAAAEPSAACQAKVVHLEQALQDVSARHQQEKQRRKVLHNSLVLHL